MSASFLGDDALALPEPGGEDPWFRKIRSLVVEIDEASTDSVTQVIASGDPEKVLGVVIKAANRVIRAIRNFALVTHISEMRPSEFVDQRWLDAFVFETSTDGVTWRKLAEPPVDLTELMMRWSVLRRDPLGEFRTKDLAEVREAVENDLAAGPERTFLANAVEYLRRGDLRVAVVESIICLEILVGQLLPELLAEKRIPVDALSREITLFPRVKMLLPLLVPADMENVDVAAVTRTIQWRNAIVHKSGHLPDGIPETNVRDGIAAVLLLARKLAHRRDLLKREPTLRRFGQEISEQCQIRQPTVRWTGKHSYVVTFALALDPTPSTERLSEVAEAVVAGLQLLDPRCQPGSDVFIFFSTFGKEIATWQGGQFGMIVDRKRPVAGPSSER